LVPPTGNDCDKFGVVPTLGGVPDPLVPANGLAVLHLFCRPTGVADPQAVASAVKAAEADEMQVVPVALLGHKAEVGFMVLGRDWWRLRRFQTEVEAAGLIVVDSYVSLTEVSEYAQGMPDHMKEPRLHPQLPPEGKTAWCFYPMSKRRLPEQNWFTLPYDERKELMFEHGASGRTFAGRVLQVVTGSTGLDDYEWGVTLFAVHPTDLKDVVYTMRYDRASALYAEFGTFYTGMVGGLGEVLNAAGVTG
jgi:hydrogen peroxide-dependent heme synthase